MANLWRTILRILGRDLPQVQPRRQRASFLTGQVLGTSTYPGDFRGHLEITYDPHPNGRPDPGEIVWAWVPFEEDHNQGKDRPVLLIGRDGPWLLGLQLTSKDNNQGNASTTRGGRTYVDIGAGAWDPQGRPSEVRVNRVVRIDPALIRREGSILDEGLFARVAAAVQQNGRSPS